MEVDKITGPIIQEMGNLMRAMGVQGWWDRLLAAIAAGKWAEAQNFAKTLGAALRNKVQDLPLILQRLKALRAAMAAEGVDAVILKEIDAIIALVQRYATMAAAEAGELAIGGTTAASGGGGLLAIMVIMLGIFVLSLIFGAKPAPGETLDEAARKKAKDNYKKAKDDFIETVRQACPCVKKRQSAAAGSGPSFPSLTFRGGTFGGAGGGSAFPTAGLRPMNGTGAAKGGGASAPRPNPFAFPQQGGPPMSPFDKNAKPRNPAAPSVLPPPVCTFPICGKHMNFG